MLVVLTRGRHGCIVALSCLVVCRPSEYLDSFNILLKAAAARVGSCGSACRVPPERLWRSHTLFGLLLMVVLPTMHHEVARVWCRPAEPLIQPP